jgi:L-arabinose isomerase
MINLRSLEVWLVTGSQHLYGAATLRQVAANAQAIAESLDAAAAIPVRVVAQPVVASAEDFRVLALRANATRECIGLIFWMHTFSPGKMWLDGLRSLQRPILQLHTQFNERLPWKTIDMDFMNLHQSAHGDREFGFITSRFRLPRKVVTGHWREQQTLNQIGVWTRAAAGWHESQQLKVARFGDNMREVAVTEGDKLEAQAQFGFTVDGFGVGDLAAMVNQVTDAEATNLVREYRNVYSISKQHDLAAPLEVAARIELGLRAFLTQHSYDAFTDTFQDLHGIAQLPGIAVQRLMADGYGFAAEGDWKTAALVRLMKIMAVGLPGGTSFMEDYTYDLAGTGMVLGSHMLEICPSIAAHKPSLEVHPLSIGGKADPVRLVFTAPAGRAIVASLIDLGNRFRLIANEVDVIDPEEPLPRLPVARAVWIPRPSLSVAATAWLYAGGAHHTAFSQALTLDALTDLAEIAQVELISITAATRLDDVRKELRWNDLSFKTIPGFRN